VGTETSLGYDAGVYRKIGKKFDARVTGNYINTSNYFVTNTASIYYTGSFTYQMKSMKFYGAEAEFNWAPMEKLTLFGNYSYLKNSYSKEANLPYAVLLELPPRNKGKLSIRYSLPAKARLLSDIKFVGRRGTEGGYVLDRYALVDVSLEKSIARKMTVSAFMNNASGMDYQQVYGYPSPGRIFGIRLQVNPSSNPFAK
jgi:outer membrane receptor protein involved in Fe transport